MKYQLSKSLHFYYLTILAVLGCFIAVGMSFYWTRGPVNMESISSVFEATIQVDELERKNSVGEIKRLVENSRVRDAVKVVENFEKEIKSLNKVKEVDSYEDFKQNITSTKKAINGLLSYPELSSVILVLGNKITNFESFVVQNNWRTLTRISRRVKTKIAPGRISSPGFYNYSKVKKLASNISKDIKLMEDVTTNSFLSRQEKQLILTKIKTLKTEVRMLNKYLASLKKFNLAHASLDENYKQWMSEFSPGILYHKIQLEKSSKYLVLGSIILVSFVFIAMVGGFFVQRNVSKKDDAEVEKIIIRTVRDNVIPTEPKIEDHASKEFLIELEKYREHIHKRMSFGSVFQEAIPFSCLLLDSNLNLSWGNSLFYETWKLEENKDQETLLSWDYLQQFTNLGENDPIVTAHTQQIAGIYQVQVKRGEEAQPYEMYVSPVEYLGQSRIMIMLYPLRSIEEALSNQTKSIVGPITRSLDAMTESRFDEKFRDCIAKDFEIAGISEVFEKFQQQYELVNQQKHGLLSEIDRLENDLYDQYKLIDDMRLIFEEKTNLNVQTIRRFKEAKDSIVSVVELRNEMESLYQNTLLTSQELFEEELELLEKSAAATGILEDNAKAFETIIKTRDDFKKLSLQVEEFKSRITRQVDQTLVMQRNSQSPARIEESLSQIKSDFRDYERTLNSFGKVLTSLDVGISKVQMIMESGHMPNFGDLKKKFSSARASIETDMINVSKMSRVGQSEDAEVVRTLRSLIDAFKEGREKLKELSELVAIDEEVLVEVQHTETSVEYSQSEALS